MNSYETQNVVIRLKKVLKSRKKGGSCFELKIPSFEVCTGEFIAIVGASGCGKSTLLDMLGLVLKPTSADEFFVKARTDDHAFHIMNSSEKDLANIRKAQIGYVLQTGGLLPFLSVKENIYLPCLINGLKEYPRHLDTLIERLSIKDQMNKKPQFLSGGQRQRVAIARALAHRPPIVLADEPTAAVDSETAEVIIRQFQMLSRQLGVTLIMVTHDRNLIKGVPDRIFTFSIDPDTKRKNYTLSNCIEIKGNDNSSNIGRCES